MLEIRNLSVWFHTTEGGFAVRDVSMRLPEGRRTVMIGETGSGKSVMLQAILRLLPGTAHCSGEVLLDGVNLMELSPRAMRRVRGAGIGYIPQGNGSAMNPLLRVGFQVGEGLMEHRHLRRRAAMQRAISLLAQFHLGDEARIARTYPHMLSGGMRQRALIAMGVAANAPVLFADEPTKGLDEARITQVADTFRGLRQQTLLCVTHDLGFARAIADRIAVMYAAAQLEIADCADFFQNPLHPYAQALLASQAENGFACEIGFAPPSASLADSGCVFSGLCPRRWPRCDQEPPMFDVSGRKVRCWLYER